MYCMFAYGGMSGRHGLWCPCGGGIIGDGWVVAGHRIYCMSLMRSLGSASSLFLSGGWAFQLVVCGCSTGC